MCFVGTTLSSDKDIAGEDENGVAAQLTDRETFVAAMQERGVGKSKRVVVYDNGDMLFATRFWWAMRQVMALFYSP